MEHSEKQTRIVHNCGECPFAFEDSYNSDPPEYYCKAAAIQLGGKLPAPPPPECPLPMTVAQCWSVHHVCADGSEVQGLMRE